MESLAIAAILMILLAALVLTIVLLEVRKSSRRREKGLYKKPFIETAVPADSPQKEKVKPQKSTSGTSIYQYTEQKQRWCCPACEGENPMSRISCGICGWKSANTGR